MHKTSFSIRTKLMFSYVLLLFICILLYSFFNFQSSRQYLREEKILLYANNATILYEDITTQLDNHSVFSTIVSSNTTIQNFLYYPPKDILDQRNVVTETIEPMLSTYKLLNPSVLDLTLYMGTPGNMIQTDTIQFISPDLIPSNNSYSNEYFWIYEDNKLIQRTLIYNLEAGLSKPVGFLEITANAAEIFQTAFSNDENGFFINILTKDGQIVWCNQNDCGSIQENKMVFIASIPMENTPLTVTFSIPSELFYSTVNYSAISNTLLLFALCIIISGIFVFLYSHVITKNIRTLTDIINTIDQSNLDLQIDMENNDEIGILADCLNEMLSRINLLISDIYQAKEAEKQMELDALRTQINPHFLYNTMDVINWMAIGEDSEAICNVTGLLSQYYRTMLNHGEACTTLEEELDNIKSYIGIQLIMHGNSFDVEYEYDEHLLQYKVPNFILQPAVENAIKHGIDLISTGKGLLRIVLLESEGYILVDISDNGLGLTEEQLQSVNEMLKFDQSHSGYGLHNVQRRIQLAYGKEYGITLSGKPGEGCVTRFRLPIVKNESPE